MKVSAMFPDKYLNGSDLAGPVIVTIARIATEEVYKPGKGKVKAFVMYCKNARRGVVLSKPLAESIAQALGDDESDHWPGKDLVLYPEPMVVAGEHITAIRARGLHFAPGFTPANSTPEPDQTENAPESASTN